MENPSVIEFFDKQKAWKHEMTLLRKYILDCGLTEDIKWKVPCYTHKNANIVLYHGFKEYCAISFFKGSLLGDSEKILIQQTENSESGRQIRFKNIEEIVALEKTIKAYIFEAIEIENQGLKIAYSKPTDMVIPEELKVKFSNDLAFKKAFEALTPGRQKGYLLFFNGTKQSKTIQARIEKSVSRIMNGKGLMDCICGLSKRMPNCDGSHKFA